jgi:hypothetical protein
MTGMLKLWLAVLVALQILAGSAALMTMLPATAAQLVQVIVAALEGGTAAYLGRAAIGRTTP